MNIWSKRNLAVWTVASFALAAGCNVTRDGDAGTSSTSSGTGAGAPICTAAKGDTAARFTRSSGPDIRAFTTVAATPGVVLASAGEGIHRSTDGGDTWSFVDAGELVGKPIIAMAALGSEVFVTTGTAVYKTADGGDTWTDVSTIDCPAPSYLTVHGSNLYVLSQGTAFAWNAAAETWDALPAEQMFDVIESDGTSLYANSIYVPGVFRRRLDIPNAEWTAVEGLSEWGYRAFAFIDGHGFAANTEQLFRSDDDGATWAPVGVGSPVTDLLVVNGAILAATDAGVRVSTDQGMTWQSLWEGAFSSSSFALAADGKHLFAARGGLRRATSAGSEWSRLRVLGDSIPWLVATETSVLARSEDNLFRSTDHGATWSDLGPLATGLRPVVLGQKIFGLADQKLIVSNDDGLSFSPLPLPSEIASGYVNLFTATEDMLVLGVAKGAGSGCSNAQDITTTLYRSIDGGVTWSGGMSGFPTTFTDCYGIDYTPMITGVARSGRTLLATSYHNGAFRSADEGASWQPIATPADVGSLREFITIGDSLFAAAENGGVARSTDGGVSWKKVGLSTLGVSSFAVKDGALYASVGAATAPDGGVYATMDGGDTWTRIDAQFDARVGQIVWQDGHLVAGTLDESVWSFASHCAAAP